MNELSEKPVAPPPAVVPGTTPGATPAKPVAGGSPGNGTANPPAPVVGTPPTAGGGKKPPSIFKFPVGTPEGDEERREHERKRKQAARAVAAKLVEPPPLPSTSAPGADSNAATAGPLALDGGAPASPAEALVPWDPQVLKPFVVEAVNATEAARVKQLGDLCEEADFPAHLIKEICHDAKYVPAFKNSVILSAPNVIAKLFNRSGISGKYSDEAILALSLASIWFQGYRLKARLQEMIEEEAARRKAAEPPTPKLP